VAIEAGLAGRPVVATAVGGVSTVVLDGRTGVLLADASPAAVAQGLRIALADAAELGAAAQIHCLDGFTMERVARLWADLLDDVVQRRPIRR
jgi:glycosyltransferase involved in cell wall biosynthesis